MNVSPESDRKELKKAYIKLARTYHPDKNRGNKLAEKKFQQINRAWDVLKDPKARESFDKKLALERQKKQSLFSAKVKSPTPPQQIKKELPLDLEISLTVSVEDMCLSRAQKISYFKPINGKDLKHSFDFQIPLGSKPGTKLYFKEKGGSKGKGTFGDLYVKLSLSPHKLFHFSKENGSSDLCLERPVSFVDIIERNKIEIPSPYGSLFLKQPLSLEDTQVLKIKGQGLPKTKRERGGIFL